MKLKVLVVDDEKVLAEALAERLSLRKANAATAHTGKEAIDRVSKFRPDVVLLDCRLPDIDGFEVLKQIKKDYPTTEVIMYTGYVDRFKRKEAEKLGAFGYFEKPADFEDIWVSMLQAVRQKVEDYETAITFAQAGLHDEAREIIKKYNS